MTPSSVAVAATPTGLPGARAAERLLRAVGDARTGLACCSRCPCRATGRVTACPSALLQRGERFDRPAKELERLAPALGGAA